MTPRYSAMILTGGSSKRFGSDKSLARIDQLSLIQTLLTSLPLEIEITIVGPKLEEPTRAVRYTREGPIGGGPVAAIDAGVALIDTEYVAVIATDMPFASQIVEVLLDTIPFFEDAIIPMDSRGVRQPLCALYRTQALVNAIKQLGSTQGQSVRKLIQTLSVKEFSLAPNLARILLDVDTPSDLERAKDLSKESKDQGRVYDMEKWIEAVQKELGIDVVVDEQLILDLARDAAHGVERKAAPITTFLLGIAIAGGADQKEAAKRVAELAGRWPTDT